MASIEIQIPVEIKIFVPAQTTKLLRFLAQVALHLGERFGGVHDRKTTASLHLFDLFEDLNQLLGLVADQTRIAETEIARCQRRQWITEGATLETKLGQKLRQLVIIVNEFAGRDAR